MSEDSAPKPVVGLVMGSDSDWPVMKAAATALEEFDVPFEADVVSAHRMPEEMLAYGKDAGGGITQPDHSSGHSLSFPRSPRNHAAACRARSRQSSRSSPYALTCPTLRPGRRSLP